MKHQFLSARNSQSHSAIALAAALLLVALLPIAAQASAQSSTETAAQRDARMGWWREARFGLFIHWGVYAHAAGEWNGKEVPGIGEWIMHHGQIPVAEYETLPPRFNPVKFDADAWVRTARAAGMKYIIITSKHHDGFCMFDSKLTTYDIVDATPFKRDPLKELAAACREHGLKLGFYHSIMDWHHPDAKGARFPKYVEHMKGQIRELLSNYGPIAVMWFDGEWIEEWTEEQGKELYAFCRELQPQIIINNRVGKGRDGMAGLSKDAKAAGDFGTPEQEVPGRGLPGVDWETCMTMNDTWGFKKNDHNWKASPALIRQLIDIASKGGNFLLNVGPTGEGEIPAASVERLKAMGEWLSRNGESIYGTAASPIEAPGWGRITRKGDRLYLHVFDWPTDGYLNLTLTHYQAVRAALLSDETVELPVIQQGLGVGIAVPKTAPDAVASVVVLTVKEIAVVPPGKVGDDAAKQESPN